MNYIKIGAAFAVAFSSLSGNVQAQQAHERNTELIAYNNNAQPISGAASNAGRAVAATKHNFQEQRAATDTVPGQSPLLQDGKQPVHTVFKTVSKQNLSGAVSVLEPDTYIDRDYNLRVENGMNGRVAGLLGTSSIWGMEEALVLIDGVRREFNDITLNEVDQIAVLKGVNAVALYGSQAAKGVILITTKRGEAGTRKISVRVNSGIATPKALPDYLGSAEYMTLYNEARRNDGLPDLYDAATIQNYRNGNPYRFPSVDYFSSAYLKKYQTATDANAEFSGGNNIARFYSNVGWSNSSTLLNVGEGKNEGDNRFNVRGNIDLKLNDYISSSLNVSAIFNDSRRGRGNYWNNAATLLPNKFTPLIPLSMIPDDNAVSQAFVKGSRNIIDGQYLLGGSQQFPTNPLADLYVGGFDKYIRRTFQVTNNVDVDLHNLMQGLSFHTLFNIDYANSYTQSISNNYAVYFPSWSGTADSVSGLQKFGTDSRPGTQNISNTAQRQNLGFSAWFNYLKSVNDVHNFSATLLGSASKIKTNDVYQPLTDAHLGLELNYNFKNRYFADFSGAYVNSTKLPDGNRAAFSPTVSLGWLLSSEHFLSNARAVDYLKLSASAGILNTDLDITGYYLYDNIYTPQSYFSWNDALYQNRASTSLYGANPDLTFPQRKEVNASLEGSFFNNLLQLQTTFFVTKFDGLLTQRFALYPNYYNTFIPYSNYNANQRSGFDLMLNVNKKVGNLALSLGVNATYANSKVTQRDELYLDTYQNRAGKPVDAIFGLVSKGFFQDQAEIDNSPKQVFSEVKPGDLKYVDQNGDNVIDQRDEVMIGRWTAPFNYGVHFTATYKSFNVFLLGTGINGGNALKNGDYYWVSGDRKYSDVVRGRWTPDTKSTATFPRLSSSQNNNDFRNSDFWLYKTDRFNLSKVQLTYNLPYNVLRKTFVKDLGLYVAGSNLITFSKNRDIMDLTISGTPQFRYYNVGLRARF